MLLSFWVLPKTDSFVEYYSVVYTSCVTNRFWHKRLHTYHSELFSIYCWLCSLPLTLWCYCRCFLPLSLSTTSEVCVAEVPHSIWRLSASIAQPQSEQTVRYIYNMAVHSLIIIYSISNPSVRWVWRIWKPIASQRSELHGNCWRTPKHSTLHILGFLLEKGTVYLIASWVTK